MTLQRLGGLIPAACRSNAIIVIVPRPVPRYLPIRSRPFRDRHRSAALLLAAPENLYYRPVSSNYVHNHVRPFEEF